MQTVNVYTLAELKEQFPDAFESVHNRWRESVSQCGDIPWSDETMDSLKAVIKACGGTLRDWSIGAYDSESYIRVSGIDDETQDKAWFLHNVLKPNGYTQANGHAHFPGICAFTGYCADDTFLFDVWKCLKDGWTLTAALEGLADTARLMMESDLEQQQDEESMFANWGDCRFTEDGIEV